MNHYKSSAELKQISKGQLLGKYNTVVSAFLMYTSCVLALYLLYNLFTVNLSISIGYVFDWIMQFLLKIFTGIFSIGNAFLYLNITRNQDCRPYHIFAGFKSHADKAITIQFILLVISIVLSAPGLFLFWLCSQTPSGLLYLTGCLFILAGLALRTYLYLMYSQWAYIALDYPDYSVRETLHFSRECMRGSKGRCFFLSLTFVPLYLLSLTSCCVAFLWVFPYVNTVKANFYLDLMQKRNQPVGNHFDETVA